MAPTVDERQKRSPTGAQVMPPSVVFQSPPPVAPK
jgi:hypothetical protein